MSLLSGLTSDRRLLVELARRDIRSRFAGARFGLVWSLLNPAIQLASYGLIFGYLYAGPALGPGRPFLASLFCGLWPWWAFYEGTMRGLTAMADQGALLKKMPMRPEICVLAGVTGSTLLQMLGFLLFLAIFFAIGILPLRISWLLLPVAMALSWLFTAVLALLLAPIFLVVRDTQYAVTAALTIGFFVSPVLYPTDWLAPSLQAVSALNPMTGLLGLYRTAVLGDPLPSPGSLFTLAASIAALGAAAGRVFSRLEPVLDEYW